jgi:hypothetical protein
MSKLLFAKGFLAVALFFDVLPNRLPPNFAFPPFFEQKKLCPGFGFEPASYLRDQYCTVTPPPSHHHQVGQ